MQVSRPLAFFDLETTGKETTKARIIEIGLVIIKMDGTTEEKRRLVNPGEPIPPEATAIHGITDHMVAGQPKFKEIAKSLIVTLEGCDLAGYNIDKYDIPVLSEEFARVGIDWPPKESKILDVYKLQSLHNSNSLAAVYERYFGKPLEGAHGALTDTKATLEVLVEILARYYKDGVTVEQLHDLLQGEDDPRRVDYAGKLTLNDAGQLVWAFGPHINQPVLSDLGFFNWVLSKDFPAGTKRILLNYQKQLFDGN